MIKKEEEGIILRRIDDAVRQCDLKNAPEFVGFITGSPTAYAVRSAEKSGVKYMLFGGHELAERVYFGAFPDYCEPCGDDFPIIKLKIINKGAKPFTHRDILGALMSLGIERDTVGDILTDGVFAAVFVSKTVAKHIILNLCKVASVGVTVAEDQSDALPTAENPVEGTVTVASQRLDCIVSALAGLSRAASEEVITHGEVSVNGIAALKTTYAVKNGDTVTVRHVGRFVIDSLTDKTKKGRLVVKYRK